jgi:hypothetical protein
MLCNCESSEHFGQGNGHDFMAVLDRLSQVTPNPMGWGVTIEGLGTDLPLYVTVWSGPSMISRETFGTEEPVERMSQA